MTLSLTISKLEAVATLGQSFWLDDLNRDLLESGELERLIHRGLRGVTSNPTIFEHALLSGHAYDEDIRRLAQSPRSDEAIFEQLAIDDIRRAADLFQTVYQETYALDGYVSLEVTPAAAFDAQRTLDEARRLWREVDRPNIMIKVPGTRAAWPAIETLLSEGININITLLFSIANYEQVLQAYLRALEKRINANLPIAHVASVASFFVSRVDTAADKKLAGTPYAGQLGIANAALAYRHFLDIHRSARWLALRQRGAMPQRLLWASTSVKNPAYPPLLYLEALIAPDTVNTVPPDTLARFEAEGEVGDHLIALTSRAADVVRQIQKAGVDPAALAATLEQEGVEKFKQSFEHVLQAVAHKRQEIRRVRA